MTEHRIHAMPFVAVYPAYIKKVERKGRTQDAAPLPQGVTLASRLSATTSVVHVFATRQQDLLVKLQRYREQLRPDAAIWVSWPKKASRVPTDITEDTIRALALPLGFVDVKVCAINDIWSGLKLVVRKQLR